MAEVLPRDLKRSESYELLPPNMSELRIVLLGNSWSERCSVGNLLLDQNGFNPQQEPNFKIQGKEINNKILFVINTPDLLQLDLKEDRLLELITDTAAACNPGPHVFLLVLQPEDFTDQHKTRLQSVLERFNEQAFNHSLVLISTPQGQGFMEKYKNDPQIMDMLIKCRFRYLWMNTHEHDFKLKHFKFKELLSKIHQVVNENNAKHLEYEPFEEPSSNTENLTKPQRYDILGKVKSAELTAVAKLKPGQPLSQDPFRILLLGKSNDKKAKFCNFICRKKQQSDESHGVWNKKSLTVVKTPDLFNLSKEAVTEEMRRCVSKCSPGPNVLLLLVKPSEFTKNDRETLNFILSLFGPDAFRHSMVIITHDEKKNIYVNEVLHDCNGRFYNMFEENHDKLTTNIEIIVQQNKGSFLAITKKTDTKHTPVKPSLNLVLCGSRGSVKSSVVESILSQAAAPSPGQCVKHQGEVCGRWVSLVELPALSGKPLEAVMQQCLSCISLCGPEGVHAVILVLPVGPLTDEDKAELKTIQDTFSSAVNLFTVILFTVDSDPSAPAVVDFVKGDRDLRELSQSCGGGYVIFNTRGQQQVSELLEFVHRMKDKNTPHSYTTETLVKGQREMISALHKENLHLKNHSVNRRGDNTRSDCLRISLIGKTGSGKSSSGNTILGGKQFKAMLSPMSVTRNCQKAQSTVDGRHVAVVDTLGLFDTNLSQDEVNEEMLKCISLLAPGPHVFLLVLQIGRFTQEEKDTLKLIKQAFGKGAEKFTIILFTHGDQLDNDEMPIQEYIEKFDISFKNLISDCGNRYHVFNNNEKKDRTQVKELLEKIDDMVRENGGGCYTNDMLQEAEAAIKKEMKRLLQVKDEEMKREKEEMERKYQQEKEEIQLNMDKLQQEFEKERKQRETDLKEKVEKIKHEKEQRKTEQEMREEEDRKRKDQEDRQRQEWEQKTRALEEKIKSEQESRETSETKLQESRRQMEQERELWEQERKEWWKKREKEDEERRQLEEKRQEEMRQIQKEKQMKEKELKEKEEKIKEDQEQRKREQEKREEEDRKRKEQEDKQRLEWERRRKALEEKIKSGEESKEISEMKLQESRKQMEQEREMWEKERKERWDKRQTENEERRQKETQIQEEKNRLASEKEQIEKELKEKVKQMKEERQRDEEKREEEDRQRKEQEERQHQEWERKRKDLEEKIKSEQASKETIDRELQESRRQMKQERQQWEKERKEQEEKQKQESEKRQQEEQQRMKKLQDEYDEERQRDQKKRQEEDQIRQEQEDKTIKEIKEKYQTEIERMEEKFKEARTKAEEFNDFKEKHLKEFKELKQKHESSIKDKDEKYDLLKALAAHNERTKMEAHQREVKDLVECVSKNKKNVTKINEILKKHEEQMESVKDEEEKGKLLKEQEKELNDLIETLLKEKDRVFLW